MEQGSAAAGRVNDAEHEHGREYGDGLAEIVMILIVMILIVTEQLQEK